MSISLLAPLCALLYLAATGLQLLRLSQRHKQLDRSVFALGLFALASHTLIVWKIVFPGDGCRLGVLQSCRAYFSGDQPGLRHIFDP